MREILFRAQRIEDKEWVKGQYANCCYPGKEKDKTYHFIVEYPDKYHEIFTSTVCQYTGLTDKNGKEIFEGDIVKTPKSGCGIIRFGRYSTGDYGFYVHWMNNYGFREDIAFWVDERDIEVVGNIFDNPELIKGE